MAEDIEDLTRIENNFVEIARETEELERRAREKKNNMLNYMRYQQDKRVDEWCKEREASARVDAQVELVQRKYNEKQKRIQVRKTTALITTALITTILITTTLITTNLITTNLITTNLITTTLITTTLITTTLITTSLITCSINSRNKFE